MYEGIYKRDKESIGDNEDENGDAAGFKGTLNYFLMFSGGN